MNTADPQYQALLGKLVTKMRLAQVNDEAIREDRTKVGTVSLFGSQMRFDLSKGFPILTSKKVHFPSVVSELLWFLKGDTNIRYLLEHNNHIWTDWRYKAYQDWYNKTYGTLNMSLSQKEFEQFIIEDEEFALKWGDIGKGYGHQWRNFGGVRNTGEHFFNDCQEQDEVLISGKDQISWVINEIKTNPTSRRLIVSGWNPHEVDKVDLPPCHTLFQFFVDNGKLSCQLYQRSADIFLGVPFNIASYALLTHIIAQACDLGVGEFVWTGGDVHLYSNHIEQAAEQEVRSYFDLPKLAPFPTKAIEDYEPDDFKLIGYNHHPAIKAPVAV